MVVCKVADNIITPLGFSTQQNYDSVKKGLTALRYYKNRWELPEPFVASLFNDSQRATITTDDLSFFESLVIASVRKTLEEYPISVEKENIVLIISTTKADIEKINDGANNIVPFPSPGDAAQRIADKLGIRTCPITVCNACISGVSALSIAARLLVKKRYNYAIVVGCDCQSDFIVSGFQSLKALSSDFCKPFDIERLGLNLGESVATILLTAKEDDDKSIETLWKIHSSAIRNDAYHISSPSKTAEGCYRAIQSVLTDNKDDGSISLINVHGTATMYNDQMESIAIKRSNLSQVYANGLKGYFGHTMGASGILETIISLKSLEDDVVLSTLGFDEIGVSGEMNISNTNRQILHSDNPGLLKLISGFGGCNGAILFNKSDISYLSSSLCCKTEVKHKVKITQNSVTLDGECISIEKEGKELLTELYHKFVNDYPKFYKMDILARLGFIASELLIQLEKKERFVECEDRATIIFNHSSSVVSDIDFEKLIIDRQNFYPSPSIFVYTLPNIINGEIAIRNKYYGETSFYVLPSKNKAIMQQITDASFVDSMTKSVICGWLECENESEFEADFSLIEIIK